ncbi:MAG: hypothetical protein WKF84_25505 [Pyrinomonadaceae bacterium]
MRIRLIVFCLVASFAAFAQEVKKPAEPPQEVCLITPEKHLRNVKQLTFGGENAEAYFSGDGQELIFQSKRDGKTCDQIYMMRTDGTNLRMVSNGEGCTTCSYIFPNKQRVLYASTHLASKECPPAPDFSKSYVWPIYPSYDLFTARPDGSDIKLIDQDRWLRRRSDHLNRWAQDHLHVYARRRFGSLHDGLERQECTALDH